MKGENLVILVIILFALYYLFFSKREMMSDFKQVYGEERYYEDKRGGGRVGMDINKKTKMCSQNAINDAYNTWTFGSPKFVR